MTRKRQELGPCHGEKQEDALEHPTSLIVLFVVGR